jgi:23S rRNA (cytidine1920-2'-O)/16S rRNA (cytidine1409-2'-O)-methyltransferase
VAANKRRIDQLLVERGLAESRNQAQALLLAGQVLVNEQKVDKPGHTVSSDARIRILETLPYASRAGFKLKAALDHFNIRVAGRICADLGASTGGFTDCLLQEGAAAVHTYDVGRGLLAWKLQSDARVVVHDAFNVRHITATDLPPGLTLVTVDLSFISLTKVLAPLRDALLTRFAADASAGGGLNVELLVLVKPQFEVGKGEVGKGGIVRDEDKRLQALAAVEEFSRRTGYRTIASMPSPIAGTKGNLEFLLCLEVPADL